MNIYLFFFSINLLLLWELLFHIKFDKNIILCIRTQIQNMIIYLYDVFMPQFLCKLCFMLCMVCVFFFPCYAALPSYILYQHFCFFFSNVWTVPFIMQWDHGFLNSSFLSYNAITFNLTFFIQTSPICIINLSYN